MTFSDLFRKAHGALANLRGENNLFLGRNGEVIYSKNNVCVHEASNSLTSTNISASDDNIVHTPGYLTIRCLNDDQLGVTLVLQWLPNATLAKNPASIRCISPRSNNRSDENGGISTTQKTDQISAGCEIVFMEEEQPLFTVEHIENGEVGTSSSKKSGHESRPSTFMKPLISTENESTLGIPSINLIPNTPTDLSDALDDENSVVERRISESSGSTSGADEMSEDGDGEAAQSSSYDDSDPELSERKASNMEKYRQDCETLMRTIPEQFAKEHNMMMQEDAPPLTVTVTASGDEGALVIADDAADALAMLADERVVFRHQKNNEDTLNSATVAPNLPNTPLFSVNLGKMRSMRIFYSNAEYTSGELVIASPDSQYKILHFHHGGLDKLAQLFEHWNAVKSKSVHDGSPSALPDKQLLICQPAVSRTELDPEDGLYNRVNVEFWKSYKNEDGSIDDAFTIRKAIYFASMDAVLRKEIWPFLLRVYPWNSTFEQREAICNELFLSYQSVKQLRMKKFAALHSSSTTTTTANKSLTSNNLANVESTIWKDVVRTDRRNPFFAGENNPNLQTMNSILLNYAVYYPEINYVQGMSDLLAPLLSTLRDESLTYWCFANLMKQTLFCSAPTNETRNLMEINLEYLRELLKILLPKFFDYLLSLGGDAPQLMFVHRWILLFFKREFPEADALHLWEACWSQYRTSYFHLFVCAAIVSIYGPDIMAQRLPHDEILLYFSSLAMHMDASIVLKKARGLLHNFYRLPKIPCTLAGLCELDASNEQWSSHVPQHVFECARVHGTPTGDGGDEPCPFARHDQRAI